MAERHRLTCPWCDKGEVYVDGIGAILVTVCCSKCRHFFQLDLKDLSVEKVQAFHKNIIKERRVFR